MHDNVGDVSNGWRECGGGGGVSAVVVVAGKRAMQGGALSQRQHSVINHINKARLLPLRLAALVLPQTHLPRACVATGRAGLEFGKGVRK